MDEESDEKRSSPRSSLSKRRSLTDLFKSSKSDEIDEEEEERKKKYEDMSFELITSQNRLHVLEREKRELSKKCEDDRVNWEEEHKALDEEMRSTIKQLQDQVLSLRSENVQLGCKSVDVGREVESCKSSILKLEEEVSRMEETNRLLNNEKLELEMDLTTQENLVLQMNLQLHKMRELSPTHSSDKEEEEESLEEIQGRIERQRKLRAATKSKFIFPSTSLDEEMDEMKGMRKSEGGDEEEGEDEEHKMRREKLGIRAGHVSSLSLKFQKTIGSSVPIYHEEEEEVDESNEKVGKEGGNKIHPSLDGYLILSPPSGLSRKMSNDVHTSQPSQFGEGSSSHHNAANQFYQQQWDDYYIQQKRSLDNNETFDGQEVKRDDPPSQLDILTSFKDDQTSTPTPFEIQRTASSITDELISTTPSHDQVESTASTSSPRTKWDLSQFNAPRILVSSFFFCFFLLNFPSFFKNSKLWMIQFCPLPLPKIMRFHLSPPLLLGMFQSWRQLGLF